MRFLYFLSSFKPLFSVLFGFILLSPFGAQAQSKSRMAETGMVIAAAAAGFLVDDGFYTMTQEPRGRLYALRRLSPLGEWPAPLLLYSGLYASGRVYRLPKLRHTALWGFESAIWTGLGVQAVKYLVGRKRPYMGAGSRAFVGPNPSPHAHSFPSGHTALAFSMAAAFDETFHQEHPYWSKAGFGLAALVGLSRIEANKHWFSDVIAGAGVGVLITKMVFAKHRHEQHPVMLPIYPQFSRRGLGFGWHYRFSL